MQRSAVHDMEQYKNNEIGIKMRTQSEYAFIKVTVEVFSPNTKVRYE